MSSLVLSWPEMLILSGACIAYAVFLWVNFRAGRYVMLWSSAGIVLMQAGSAVGSSNTPAYLSAAGFHAALVVAIYTATRKNGKGLLTGQTISTRE